MAKLFEFAKLPARPVSSPTGLSKGAAPQSVRSPREFIGQALERIPTDFGRLVLLGSLQDKDSGPYRGAFAALAFDNDSMDEALRQLHEETFRGWLKRDTASQVEDIVQYCKSVGRAARDLAAGWIARNDDSGMLVPETFPHPVRSSCSQNLALALATAYAQLA